MKTLQREQTVKRWYWNWKHYKKNKLHRTETAKHDIPVLGLPDVIREQTKKEEGRSVTGFVLVR